MLNQISPAKSEPRTEDVVDLLTGCHDRIRHFTGVAVKLAHAQGAASDDIRQAAAGVHRYYTVSLALHEADEEETLRPRLKTTADEMVRHALLAMSDQHMAIDDLLDGMSPMDFMLRFTLSHPGLHTTIVGTANVDHLKSNLSAAECGALPPDVYEEAKARFARAANK